MKRLLPLLGLVLLSTLTLSTPACPHCKESIPNNDQEAGASVPDAFNNSIYFMLAGFTGTLMFVTGIVVKSVRDTNQPNGFPLDQNDDKNDDQQDE